MRHRHRYLWVSPRGFGNEAMLYRVPLSEITEAERLIDRVYEQGGKAWWMTRREADRETAGNRMQQRCQARVGMDSYCNPVGPTAIVPFRYAVA